MIKEPSARSVTGTSIDNLYTQVMGTRNYSTKLDYSSSSNVPALKLQKITKYESPKSRKSVVS
jgi:hypothetical protein